MKPINLLVLFASIIKKLKGKEKKPIDPLLIFLKSFLLSSFSPLSIIPIKKKGSNRAMMISPDTIPSSKPTVTDPNQGSTSSGSRKSGASQKPPDHQLALKCPRCDSPNTKFCYYNNYSLTQPRHFCKTCRRYWTKGGALRNVPIGGGCRKNKKSKTGSRNSDDSCRDSLSGSYDSSSGLKFCHGFATAAAMEFHLGNRLPFSRLNSSSPSVYNQYISFGGDLSSASATNNTSHSCLNMNASPSSSSLMGFENYPSVLRQQGDHSSSDVGGGIMNWGVHEIGSGANAAQYNTLASSIESLSFINQDLHLKLQQQRLAMLFGTGSESKQVESCLSSVAAAGSISLLENQAQKTQPILFQNLDIPKPEACAVVNSRKSGIDDAGANNATTNAEWFIENPNIPGATTPANSSNNGNDHTSNWTNGIQAWSDLHGQYNALPQ